MSLIKKLLNEDHFRLQTVDDPKVLAGNILFYATSDYSYYGYYAELCFEELLILVVDKNFKTLFDFIKYADRDTKIREGFLSEVVR